MTELCEGCGDPATFLVSTTSASTHSCDNDLAGSIRYVVYGDVDAPHTATGTFATVQPLPQD